MKIGFILPKLRITQHQSHGVIDLGVVGGRSRGVFGGGGVFGSRGWVVSLDIGVGSFAFVFDISDETVVVVGGVGHDLDTTVGKVDSANKKSCLRNKYGN